MNTTPATNSHATGIVTAVGLMVLLLGTATGNAYAMLLMSIVALVAITIFYRKILGRKLFLVTVFAAAMAAAVVFAITWF